MEEKAQRVSLMSTRFWNSFFFYYLRFFKGLANKSYGYGKHFLFNYGFDTLLIIGLCYAMNSVYSLRKEIAPRTIKGGQVEIE